MAWTIDAAPDGGLSLTMDDRDPPVRLTLGRDFLDEEVGADADDPARRAWVDDRLPQIIQAWTARTEGGFVKKPYDRILVEELN